VAGRIHVLLVSAWYPAPDEPVGGLFVRDQARAASLHCDVTVLARATPDTPRDSREDGVRVLRVLPATGAGAGVIVNIRRLAAIHAALQQLRREAHPPDVVHGHVYYAAFLAVLLGPLHRLSVVVSEHYSGFLGGRLSLLHKAVARITFRYATLVCPVSALLEQSLVRLEPRGRYMVVPVTVDVEAFAAGVRPERDLSGPRLLTLAGPTKGLPDLLEALRLLLPNHPNSRLEVVGGGPDREALESAAVGLPVTFLGERSREHVAALMREADVLVMPSLLETFGIAPLEALAAGLPVVATTAYPVADIIADLGGVIVPPADPRALCAAVASVLAGHAPVRPDAAAEIRRRFGLEATGRQWEAIYRSVVDGSS
jgi:glycosyltransferase involved in cell wall biosynthesis